MGQRVKTSINYFRTSARETSCGVPRLCLLRLLRSGKKRWLKWPAGGKRPPAACVLQCVIFPTSLARRRVLLARCRDGAIATWGLALPEALLGALLPGDLDDQALWTWGELLQRGQQLPAAGLSRCCGCHLQALRQALLPERFLFLPEGRYCVMQGSAWGGRAGQHGRLSDRGQLRMLEIEAVVLLPAS